MYKLQAQGQRISNVTRYSINRLMLFDLSIYGHHPGYIQYLLTYWHQAQLSGEIIVLVSPRFLVEHADVVNLASQLDLDNIRFVAISQTEENSLKPRSSGPNRNLRNFQEWFLFCRYAKQLRVDHALVMYYDTYQYPLALRLNPPCQVSGIYFRPSFHYGHFSTASETSSETRSGLKASWEKFILNRVLSNPKLHRLLTLDPYVVQYSKQTQKNLKLTYLPDPVQIYEYSEAKLSQVRAKLNIDPHRKLFLLFGALTDRKGIYQLLKAISLLSKAICSQIAFAFVGEASETHQGRIESQIAALSKHCPVQIYRKYQFLPEEDVQAYYEVCDFVLALYQRHVGMSGILNLAAVKQKLVLSSDYGLMGELVKQYRLGLAVDSTQPAAIAQGIEKLLSYSALSKDSAKMKEFAEQNLASKFSQTIFEQLSQEFT